MKNIKIIAITFVSTLVLCVAGSAYGALIFSSDGKTQVVVPQPIAQVNQPQTKAGCPSVADQITMGNKYDVCTGTKLPTSISSDPIEARLQSIEARLKILEAKQK